MIFLEISTFTIKAVHVCRLYIKQPTRAFLPTSFVIHIFILKMAAAVVEIGPASNV